MAPKKGVRPITWIYDARHITDDYFENATRFHKVKGTTWRKLVGKRPQPLGELLRGHHAYLVAAKKECAMKLKKLIWSWAIGMLVCRMRMGPLSS